MLKFDRVMGRGAQSKTTLFRRRLILVFLVATSVGLMAAYLSLILLDVRFSLLYVVLLSTFVINITWTSLSFWNALIGFIFLARGNGLAAVLPRLECQANEILLPVRSAVVITVRNEKPAGVFARLRTIKNSLDATGKGEAFDYFILSDSSQRM